MIGLLAVTGMRIGEAIRLDRGDLERTPLLRGGRPARYRGSVAGERRRPAASCNAIVLMAPPR
jgi:integrase